MKSILLLSCAACLTFTASAQLTVTAESNDTVFIYALAGPGIMVSNIERNCAPDASAFFNAADANVGIEEGIMLSSGLAASAIGPNNTGSASGFMDTPGDADLDALTMWNTYDACIIEFDMTVMADTLKLDYVFGSEEYPEYIFSGFNDVFAFWVSGPGIPTPVNIAVVPGTDIPVTINNINEFTNPDYYINNGDGFEAPFSTDPFYINYDGLTVVLNANLPVTAGETYHMKMAVADASDGILDSGVFLETGSLGSLRMVHETLADNGLSFAVEKCANGYFKLTNEVPCAEPLTIDYLIAGSAINGVDYETLSGELIIPAWDSIGYITIEPIHDAIDESLEDVVLYLYNPQSGFIYDTLTMLIDDEPAAADFEASVSDLTVDFTETSGTAVTAEWNFGDGTTSTELNPTHIYATPGIYTVCVSIVNAYGCTDEYCKEVNAGNVEISTLLSEITITPNPVADVAKISGLTAGASIVIRNLQGAVVLQTTATGSTTTVSLSTLPAGIYTIQSTMNNTPGVATIEKL